MEIRNKKQKGFTLLELLVVIAIIGILASLVMVSLNSARAKGRDAARKESIHQIEVALDLYYNNHGGYPIGGSGYPPNGSSPWAEYSTVTSGPSNFLPELVSDGEFSTIPVDPVNYDNGPWCWSNDGSKTQKNTIITYHSDGTHYILCGWMENTSDSSTLQYNDVVNPWNTSEHLMADYGYSKYNYVVAK